MKSIVEEVLAELERATGLFGEIRSAHEGYGVLLEEVDELWDAIKKNDFVNGREEAIQVAAMAIRIIHDVYYKESPTWR